MKAIKVTILDTKTGKTSEHEGSDEYWWSEGNGSCDCNRSIFHLGSAAADKLGPHGVCLGSKRFLIVKAEGASIPAADFNDNYSNELVRKFLT